MVLNSPKHEEFWLGFLKANDTDFVVAVCYAAGLSAYRFVKGDCRNCQNNLLILCFNMIPMKQIWTVMTKTIDPIKKFESFKKALSNIRSETTIDVFSVTATWVDPTDNATDFKSFTDMNLGAKWLESHADISKYYIISLYIYRYVRTTLVENLYA